MAYNEIVGCEWNPKNIDTLNLIEMGNNVYVDIRRRGTEGTITGLLGRVMILYKIDRNVKKEGARIVVTLLCCWFVEKFAILNKA